MRIRCTPLRRLLLSLSLCCLSAATDVAAQQSGPGVLPGVPSPTAGGTITGGLRVADGSADGTTAGGYSWASDTNTVIYRIGSDNVGFSAGGTLRWDYNTTRILSTIPVNIARGTITADDPAISTTATWNNAGVTFTHWKANVTDTASNAASLLLDLQVGGSSKFSITKAGAVTTGSDVTMPATGEVITTSRGRMGVVADGVFLYRNSATSRSFTVQLDGVPSCTSNCGTSPSVSGVDSSFTVTMGGTGSPASDFVITFAGTAWAAAPQCSGSMALAGMVVGKLPIVLATTTTTLTVTTNGTAPGNNDKYHFQCSLGGA